MSIVQTQTTSFKAELYEGVHNLLVDEIYMALYNANADLNADTTAYSSTHEVTGTGYVAGTYGNVPLTGGTGSNAFAPARCNLAFARYSPRPDARRSAPAPSTSGSPSARGSTRRGGLTT